MIRRSEWGHRRSIRCSVWIHTETRQDEAFSTGWSDALVKEASVYPTVEWKLTEATWTRGLQHRMIRRTVSAYVGAVVSEKSCAVEATASITGCTDARKKIASDHPTVLLSAAFSQRLVWCLGLFIPPPPAHLRLLDCVEVQKSSRHIEDHIQSIQVLNSSSLDLHMLCVCA
jgi:hypothetical protein